MRKIFFAIFVFLIGCTAPDEARYALDGAGFTDIQITGYRFFACSEDDVYRTGFIAKNIHGKTVTGVVCSTFNSTIRFD